MFSFQVRRKGEDRLGSVVSKPMPMEGGVYVVVMWEDTFSFTTERVTAIEAVPSFNADEADGNIVPFGGGPH